MRVIIILFFLLASLFSEAAIYYVSDAGDDNNSGLSTSLSWKTIAKVNATTFNAGDQILFKRGDTFYGTLTTKSSGSSGNKIVYGAYGTGSNPIITGFTAVSGWTNEGGGIYSKVISSEAQTNMVIVDGINTPMGRYPNSGYLTFESHNTNISITDNQLTGSPNWTGAEAVIRKQAWIITRTLVTNHTNGTLTYTSLGSTAQPSDNYGYFFQNDLKTLDQLGEWYHDFATGKFYMFFGSVNPTTKIVRVATLNNLFQNSVAQSYLGKYLTIENITFEGCISDAVYIPNWWTEYNTISGCSIKYSGKYAVFQQASYFSLINSNVSDCASGLFLNRQFTTITNNEFLNIGIIVGQSLTYPNAIQSASNNHLIQGNSIINVGKHGISVGNGTNITVKNNFIDSASLVFSDAGGIYTGDAHANGLIDGNIVINTYGNNEGTNNGGRQGEGIYLDEYSSGLTVQNNTVANCSGSGIKLHKAHDNSILNNTFYNNLAQIEFLSSDLTTTIVNNILTGNISVSKLSTQLTMQCISLTNDIDGFGTFSSNVYARPIDDNYTIYTSQPNALYQTKTLAEWKTFSSQDGNSVKSPKTIITESDIEIIYNETSFPKQVSFSWAGIDMNGTQYASNPTLQPYTSLVLIKNIPNPTGTKKPAGKNGVMYKTRTGLPIGVE